MTVDEVWDNLNGWHENMLWANDGRYLWSELRIDKYGGHSQWFSVRDESGKYITPASQYLSVAVRILCEGVK